MKKIKTNVKHTALLKCKLVFTRGLCCLLYMSEMKTFVWVGIKYTSWSREHTWVGKNCCVKGKSFVSEQFPKWTSYPTNMRCPFLFSRTVAAARGRRGPWTPCRWEGVHRHLHSPVPKGFSSAIWTWHSREWRYFEVDAWSMGLYPLCIFSHLLSVVIPWGC